jgi:hypothetical protein
MIVSSEYLYIQAFRAFFAAPDLLWHLSRLDVNRQYTEILQSLQDVIDSFSAVRVPDFSQKYLHEQNMSEIPDGHKSN